MIIHVSLYLFVIFLSKSDALNIYKFLYHYQDLMRETISLDDGDTLSQVHRRLHQAIVGSHPDLDDANDDNQIDFIDKKALLELPSLLIKTPSNDDATLKFSMLTSGIADILTAVIIDVSGNETLLDGLKSLKLNDKFIMLKDVDNEIYEFGLNKPSKQWSSMIGKNLEKFITN